MDAALHNLLDEREIEQALIRFSRAMDERDWAAIEQILTPDAVADMGTGRLEGSAAIIGLMRRYLDHCGVTQHLLGNVLVSAKGDHATSRAYVHDVHLSTDPQSADRFYTLGDYSDRWERRDGGWRMIERMKDNRANVGPMAVFGIGEESQA